MWIDFQLPECSGEIYFVHKSTFSQLSEPVSKGIHRWICEFKGSAYVFIAINKAIHTGPRGPEKIDYESPFFTILFSASNKGRDMGVPTKRFTVERAKNGPMLYLILQICFHMLWILASRGVPAGTRISKRNQKDTGQDIKMLI